MLRQLNWVLKSKGRVYMQKITTFLMFEDHAKEAVDFYVSIFDSSEITSTMPGPNGSVMGATFILDGHEFNAFNGGPHFSFSPGISLFVSCDTQEDIDEKYENSPKAAKNSRADG